MSFPRQAGDGTPARLHVVTGKGGTGKTTAAGALALSLADAGGDVLLVEVEGRQGIAELFERPALPYAEQQIAAAPGGSGRVYALAANAEDALLEYLEMFYSIRRAGQLLTRLGAVDFATTIAPGVRDVLLTGRAVEAVRRRKDSRHRARWAAADDGRPDTPERFAYSAVVVDAPPTGRIAQFLNVNAEVVGVAKVGPIRNHAERVMRVIRSAQTAVHFVTTLEEMPVQECIDGIGQIRQIGVPVGSIVINMARDPLLDPGQAHAAAEHGVDAAALAEGLRATPLDAPDGAARELAAELSGHARRVEVEAGLRRRIGELELPTWELPYLEGGVGQPELSQLAARFAGQGAR